MVGGTFSFLLGALFGSFSNVLIYRLPQDLSIVFPRSFCPSCKKKIKWYENFPVLSFLFLRGRCSGCKEKIPVSYPFTEFVFSLFFLAAYIFFGNNTPVLLVLLTAFFFAYNIAAIDFRHLIIPDSLNRSLLISGLILAVFNPVLKKDILWDIIFPLMKGGQGVVLTGLNSLLRKNLWGTVPIFAILFIIIAGIISGFVLLYAVRRLGEKLYKKEAMGMGDVLYLSAIGSYTGPSGVFYVIFISSFAGAVVSLLLIVTGRRKKQDEIPFGPFISFGFITYLIYCLM